MHLLKLDTLFCVLQYLCIGMNYVAACPYGFYGPNCEHKCSEYCGFAKDKRTQPCYSTTGNCQNNCISGWKGLRCNAKCPPHCKSMCHQTRGTCYECIVGWTRDTCDTPCPQHCQNGCDQKTAACPCQ